MAAAVERARRPRTGRGRPRAAPRRRRRSALRSPVVAARRRRRPAGRGRRRGRRGLAADLPHRADRPGPGHAGRPGQAARPLRVRRRSTSIEVPEVREVADADAAEARTGARRPAGGRPAARRDRRADLPGRRPGGRAMFTFSAEKAAPRPRDSGETLPAAARRASTAAGSGWPPARGSPMVWSEARGMPGAGRGARGRADRGVLGRAVRDRPRLPAVAARRCRTTSRRSCAASPRDGTTLPLPVPAEEVDERRGRRRRGAGHRADHPGRHAWRAWCGCDDGVVTVVAGSLSADEVLSVARGLRWGR